MGVIFHALYGNKPRRNQRSYAVVHEDSFARDWDGIDRAELMKMSQSSSSAKCSSQVVQGLTRLIMRYPEPLASLADLRIKGIDQIILDKIGCVRLYLCGPTTSFSILIALRGVPGKRDYRHQRRAWLGQHIGAT